MSTSSTSACGRSAIRTIHKFQIVFGVADGADPAADVVSRLQREFPAARLEAGGRPASAWKQPQGEQPHEHDAARPTRLPGHLGQRRACAARLSVEDRAAAARSGRRHRHLSLSRQCRAAACGRCSARCSSTTGSFPRCASRPCPDRVHSRSASPSRCAAKCSPASAGSRPSRISSRTIIAWASSRGRAACARFCPTWWSRHASMSAASATWCATSCAGCAPSARYVRSAMGCRSSRSACPSPGSVARSRRGASPAIVLLVVTALGRIVLHLRVRSTISGIARDFAVLPLREALSLGALGLGIRNPSSALARRSA